MTLVADAAAEGTRDGFNREAEPWATAPASPTVEAHRRASRIFVHVNFVFCLLLQRFCVFVGGGAIYWCLAAFLGSLGWMLWTGRARLRPLAILAYGAFAAIALVSTLVALNTPDQRINGFSLPSLGSVLILYLGLLVAPTARFDGSATLDLFVQYARWIAAAGLAQYAAQFAGLSVFAFGDWAPWLRSVLVEPYFNYHPVVSYGSWIMRSNGLVLLEPSIFSQVLMLAVVVDVFVRRDWRFLPLYGLAYLSTYAGTGLLAFAIAAVLSLVLAPRASGRLALLLAAGAVLALLGALVVPGMVASLAGRSSELNYSGSSGYARYMVQFDVLGAFSGELRTLIGFGPGALERMRISVAGSVNPVLKIVFEYGIVGLILFAACVVGTWWRRDMALVSLYLLVNYQLGGGYLLFMPFVVLVTLLCLWSAPVRADGYLDGAARVDRR